jgi:hypothetical protein
MKYIFFIALFVLSSLSHAGNTEIIKCRVANKEGSAQFVLDAVGAGFLTFKNSSSPTTHTCLLKLEFIRDGQGDLVPHFLTKFTRLSCSPELGNLNKELLKDLTLNINLTNSKKPEGQVQWLRRKQPDTCVIEKLSVYDVSMNAKKWSEGKWGRGK